MPRRRYRLSAPVRAQFTHFSDWDTAGVHLETVFPQLAVDH